MIFKDEETQKRLQLRHSGVLVTKSLADNFIPGQDISGFEKVLTTTRDRSGAISESGKASYQKEYQLQLSELRKDLSPDLRKDVFDNSFREVFELQ